MKLALGSAQFGLDYGVSNTRGRVPADEVAAILRAAEAAGVSLIDTAWAYGDAEQVLGTLDAARYFRIVTKTAQLGEEGVAAVGARISESLSRLGVESVYGLLVHSADDLLGESGPQLAETLMRLRDAGAVEHLGISAYGEEQLFAALDVLDADLVQVPVNVFDQRLLASGALAALKARGIEVHARSAFLQGLLLMVPDELPEFFAPIRGHVDAWHAFCSQRGLTPLQAALGFVVGAPEVDKVIVGVESAEQLAEVVSAATPLDPAQFADLALDDPAFVDPSRWRVS